MSTDVRQQIRELARLHESNRQPVELPELERSAAYRLPRPVRPSLRGPALGAAVMVALVVVLGGLALLYSNGGKTPPANSVTPTTTSSSTFGGLVWERLDADQVPAHLGLNPVGSVVIDADDRFVVFGGGDDPTQVGFSPDGVSWTTRQLQSRLERVGWPVAVWDETGILGGSDFVSVVHPDGSVEQSRFDGSVETVAIGPAGMIVTITPTLDAEPEVYAWFSQTGTDWMPIPGFPLEMRSVVGTETGFIGLSYQLNGETAWYSADGLLWVRQGDLPPSTNEWRLGDWPMKWRQGVVATDGRHYAHVSPDGIQMLTDPPLVLSTVNSSAALYLAGDLGIVLVNPETGTLLVTADGESWHASELPPDMTYSFGWHPPSGAVTGQAVLLLLWEEVSPGGPQLPAFWLGTLSEG